jgi:Ca2+-binding RTX toxin-like protein
MEKDMKIVTINSNSNSTVDALSKDTTYDIIAGVKIDTTSGNGIEAGNGATGRNITVEGQIEAHDTLQGQGIGIEIGMVKPSGAHVGGGELDVAIGGIAWGQYAGVLCRGDDQIVNNAGTISSANNALVIQANGFDVTNSGTLAGRQEGLWTIGSGSLHNTSTISGNLGGEWSEGDHVSIVNAGSILSSSGNALVADGDAYHIRNSGTISGFGDGLTFAVAHGSSVQAQTHYIRNSGTIAGNSHAIVGIGGRELIVNSGTISGDVSLGGGDDRIVTLKGGIYGIVSGGKGDDVYVIGHEVAHLSEKADGGTDLVKSSVSHTLGDNFENLKLLGGADIDGGGNLLDNVLTGNRGNNALSGGEGNDVLFGGKGDDLLTGGTGADHFVFKTGGGHDTLTDLQLSGKSHDLIDLAGVQGFHALSDLDGHMTQAGYDTLIDLGNGDMLTLKNVLTSELHASDFLF